MPGRQDIAAVGHKVDPESPVRSANPNPGSWADDHKSPHVQVDVASQPHDTRPLRREFEELPRPRHLIEFKARRHDVHIVSFIVQIRETHRLSQRDCLHPRRELKPALIDQHDVCLTGPWSVAGLRRRRTGRRSQGFRLPVESRQPDCLAVRSGGSQIHNGRTYRGRTDLRHLDDPGNLSCHADRRWRFPTRNAAKAYERQPGPHHFASHRGPHLLQHDHYVPLSYRTRTGIMLRLSLNSYWIIVVIDLGRQPDAEFKLGKRGTRSTKRDSGRCRRGTSG